MRKLRRGIMRHQAEKSGIKTKRAFRIMWRDYKRKPQIKEVSTAINVGRKKHSDNILGRLRNKLKEIFKK